MIVVPLGVRLRAILVREIDAVPDWKRRKTGEDLVPRRIPLHANAHSPLLRDPQPVSPVGQLERRIPRLIGRMVFLSRNQGRSEHIAPRLLIEKRVWGHELRRLKDVSPIPLQRLAIPARFVTELCVYDRMRLLPDKQRTDRGRAVASLGPNHLRPPR